jgi:hypothetical protein
MYIDDRDRLSETSVVVEEMKDWHFETTGESIRRPTLAQMTEAVSVDKHCFDNLDFISRLKDSCWQVFEHEEECRQPLFASASSRPGYNCTGKGEKETE